MEPTLRTDQKDQAFILYLEGRLDSRGSAALWKEACQTAGRAGGRNLVIDLTGVTYLDTAGAVLISRLAVENGQSDIQGLAPEFSPILELARTRGKTGTGSGKPKPLSWIEHRGEKLADSLLDAREFITFTGEIFWALLSSLRHPTRVRWPDTVRVAERAGVDALPIVALISFIVGLVMAFQAAIPMKMFGAEIYVANLIGIAMVRELAPLMTAIVLAGRSASAFAAEIGTMKINEEIDALTVMGLEPVRFLIVPRIIASTLITPLLTLFANLVGILGGAVVILSFDYPFITYYNQVAGFVTWQDFLGGLIKCFVFGVLIAATGCIRGYQTGQGASAVGEATTRAVVSSIILIAVFDGVFSVVYYSLGI